MFASLFSNDSSKITELDVSRNHTETMFEQFNIPISISGKEITTQPNAIEHIKLKIFMCLVISLQQHSFIVAALITPGSDITIHNVGINPTRSGIIDIVKQMEGNIECLNITDTSEPTASIRVKYTPNLKPVLIEGDIVPKAIDELPIIALLCTKQVLVLLKMKN